MTRRDTTIVHEPCDVESADARGTDINGDGRPDLIQVFKGGRELCRSVDLNFDSRVDAWVYFDDQGQVRRRESDYDRDGRIDEIALYQAGVLTEQHRATTLGGRLDSWHFFQGGKLSRTERDSDGDGVIDQWWEYPDPEREECPRIHSDVDGDGRPDPGATVDVCGEGSGYVPPARDDQGPTSPTFEPGGSMPLELENKAAPDEEAEDAP